MTIESVKIGSIVIRCFEFDRMLAFWREALHYVHSQPVEGGWVILHDPDVADESRGAGARKGHLTELFMKAGLRGVEETAIHEGGLGTWKDLALVSNLSHVEPVAQ